VNFLLSAQSEDDPVGGHCQREAADPGVRRLRLPRHATVEQLVRDRRRKVRFKSGVRCIQIFRCRDLPGLLCRVGRAVQFLKDSLEQLIEFATKRTVCGKECLEDHKANGHRNLAFHYWRVALSFRTCEAMKQPRYEGRSAFQRPFHPARARIC
jgi:hypothetical protein